MGVSAGVEEESDDRLQLAVPPRSAGGAWRTPWPVRPKASGFPPSPCARAGNGGGDASAGRWTWAPEKRGGGSQRATTVSPELQLDARARLFFCFLLGLT